MVAKQQLVLDPSLWNAMVSPGIAHGCRPGSRIPRECVLVFTPTAQAWAELQGASDLFPVPASKGFVDKTNIPEDRDRVLGCAAPPRLRLPTFRRTRLGVTVLRLEVLSADDTLLGHGRVLGGIGGMRAP